MIGRGQARIGLHFLFLALCLGRAEGGDRLLPVATLVPEVSSGLKIIHVLDVKAEGNLLFAAGYGGLSIFDITDPRAPRQLSNLNPITSATETFYWRLEVKGGYVYLTRRQGGMDIVDATDPAHPRLVGNYRFDGEIAYEGITRTGDTLCLGAYGRGVELVDISLPEAPRHLGFVPGRRAFAAQLLADHLLVADLEEGLVVYDVRDLSRPRLVARDSSATGAQFLAASGGILCVARGSAGIRVYNLEDARYPRCVAEIGPLGACFHLTLADSLLFLAEGLECEVYDLRDPAHPIRLGREPAAEWISGIAARGSWVFLADWEQVRILERGEGPEADLFLSPSFLGFGGFEPGVAETGTLLCRNVGDSPVFISGIEASDPAFSAAPRSLALEPGEESLVTVTFEPPSAGRFEAQLRVISNDADRPVQDVPLLAGTRDLGPGDVAPDFSLVNALDGRTIRLSELRGRPVLITFFAGW